MFALIVGSLVWLVVAKANEYASRGCVLRLGKSLIVDGVGVYAGKNFVAGETIDQPAVLMVQEHYTLGDKLDYYSYHHAESIDDVVLGNVIMFNHHHNTSVKMIQTKTPATRYLPKAYSYKLIVAHNITAGQEMLTSYGSNEWFKQRNITEVASKSSLEQDYVTSSTTFNVQYYPGCTKSSIRVYHGRVYTT